MVRPRRVQQALPTRRAAVRPGPAALRLRPRPAERRRPHQRLARVRPAVRVRLLPVVVAQVLPQPPLELRRAREIPQPQELPRQHAEEQFHLVQP